MLFPSDLGALDSLSQPVRVAGRALSGSLNTVTLADAFCVLVVHGADFGAVVAGDLLVVSGHFVAGALHQAELVSRQPAPLPRGDGELGRFVFERVGSALLARSQALAQIRAYFAEERFIEVETPVRVPAPGVDAHVEASAAPPGWLITSPELEMKRLVVGGVPRQFQLARVHRRDEAGTLHEPEFTLLEWYRAFAGQAEILRDTEQLVSRVARALRGRAELQLASGRLVSAEPPFERITVSEAFHAFAAQSDVVDLAASDEGAYFRLLVERIEPALARFERPVFLHDYPLSQAALARPCPDSAGYAERFELYVGGVELSNGYGELTDPVEQRTRFEREQERRRSDGRGVYPLNERFLAALVEGMPPTGGNALGVDRLLMLALGAADIQHVVAFPERAR